jgi:hypothetical protein
MALAEFQAQEVQPAEKAPGLHQVVETARRLQQLVQGRADLGARFAGRVGRADDSADAGPGYGADLGAHFVQRLQHRDVCQALGAAAAKRNAKRLAQGEYQIGDV